MQEFCSVCLWELNSVSHEYENLQAGWTFITIGISWCIKKSSRWCYCRQCFCWYNQSCFHKWLNMHKNKEWTCTTVVEKAPFHVTMRPNWLWVRVKRTQSKHFCLMLIVKIFHLYNTPNRYLEICPAWTFNVIQQSLVHCGVRYFLLRRQNFTGTFVMSCKRGPGTFVECL